MRLHTQLITFSAGMCLSLALGGSLSLSLPQNVLASPTHLSALSSTGERKTPGWVQNGDQWQYVLSDGSLVRGGWMKVHNGWYYFDTDGTMASDTTLTIEGHTYSFEGSGAWKEDPPSDQLFVHLSSGQFESSVYEHPWAGIRISLPDQTSVRTAEKLTELSAHDYIPGYYDFLAVTPEMSLFGVVVQYNSDPLEQILSDDLDVFSAFWGKYDLAPTDPQPVTVAGQTYQKMVCSIPGDLTMNVYLRNQDNKVVYLFSVAADEESADRLIDSVAAYE